MSEDTSNRDLTPDELVQMLANPFYAINISPRLFPQHEPLISKEQWVEMTARSMLRDDRDRKLKGKALEKNIHEQLYLLLKVLETGGP